MKQGTIIKALGGFYYVASGDEVFECRARGKFRLDGVSPLPGDHVLFRIENNKSIGGYVEEIKPRKNRLVRPPVANIDQICLVVSLNLPKPDLQLIDKLLVNAFKEGVEALLVMNKADIAKDEILDILLSSYAHLPMSVFRVSAKDPETLKALRETLKGKITCFTGQSAVGKSSILNALSEDFDFETGEIIKKTGRGKQTTRSIQLRKLNDDSNSFVMDTPGFTVLEIADIEELELSNYYPEMAGLNKKCRFDDCLHVDEPDCAVKNAVYDKVIPQGRYQSYLSMLSEIKAASEKRYK